MLGSASRRSSPTAIPVHPRATRVADLLFLDGATLPVAVGSSNLGLPALLEDMRIHFLQEILAYLHSRGLLQQGADGEFVIRNERGTIAPLSDGPSSLCPIVAA